MARIRINDTETEFTGTILSFMEKNSLNADSFLYLVDGRPVPVDSEPCNDDVVVTMRVASGG